MVPRLKVQGEAGISYLTPSATFLKGTARTEQPLGGGKGGGRGGWRREGEGGGEKRRGKEMRPYVKGCTAHLAIC